MNNPSQQIIALGGGGFSMEPDNPALDIYVLEQSPVPNPEICFIPTASGDSDRYVVEFYKAFSKHHCRPSHMTLFRETPDLDDLLLSKDILYVGGGNTISMLGLWMTWDIPRILRLALEKGILLAGISAGAICWFEAGITDSLGSGLCVLACMGFLPGSCRPHFDGDPRRRPTFHQFLAEGQIQPGIAFDDGCAGHYVDGQLAHVVSSRPEAQAYRLEKANGSVVETPIPSQFLK